jgi:hypothetical protein
MGPGHAGRLERDEALLERGRPGIEAVAEQMPDGDVRDAQSGGRDRVAGRLVQLPGGRVCLVGRGVVVDRRRLGRERGKELGSLEDRRVRWHEANRPVEQLDRLPVRRERGRSPPGPQGELVRLGTHERPGVLHRQERVAADVRSALRGLGDSPVEAVADAVRDRVVEGGADQRVSDGRTGRGRPG